MFGRRATAGCLYGHYNVPDTGFSALSPGEQKAFYAKACELRAQDPDGKLRFSKLQGLLQESLVKREAFLTEKRDTGKFLPLSVYEKQGYDVEPIREHAEQPEDPLLLVFFAGLFVSMPSKNSARQYLSHRLCFDFFVPGLGQYIELGFSK